MGKTEQRTFASYRAMPQQSRFWIYSQSCYTTEDLEFREWVIKARTNSGIHSDYLNNPSSWFSEDSQALINIYQNSWVFSAAFKPRQVLSSEDFYVQPIDALRLNWPLLHNLMQQTGDYLLLRNEHLSADNLNQPMNYVLLDIIHMLRGLSQNANMEQVQEQLKLITKYVRTIEKHVSPMVGSDRLFLANFRETIHGLIMPQINHRIESRILQNRLQDLSKIVHQISSERNRILHFALSAQSVNPHPYEFSLSQEKNLASYPTQAAKACLEQEPRLITAKDSSSSPSSSPTLKECADFSLITPDDEINTHYQKAIEDLKELDNFQTLITQISSMLDQAGEIYTIQQFKQQMLGLFENINHFLVGSSQRIDLIINENTQAYHKAIQAQQDLPMWKKWFTTEELRIKTFIKNQDTLAQFPSGSPDLAKTTNLAQMNSREIIKRLEEAPNLESSIQVISDKAQELDKLMSSMHGWISTQQQSQGLPLPEAPSSLRLIKESPIPLIKPAIISLSANQASFFSTTAGPSFDYCPSGSQNCSPPPSNNNEVLFLALGFMIAIPTILFGLYLLFKPKDKVEPQETQDPNTEDRPSTPSKQTVFQKYLTEFEDLLAKMKGYEKASAEDLFDGYEPFVQAYLKCKIEAQSGRYNIAKIKEACADLNYFYQEYNNSSNRAIAS